jgi:hypothetical protein
MSDIRHPNKQSEHPGECTAAQKYHQKLANTSTHPPPPTTTPPTCTHNAICAHHPVSQPDHGGPIERRVLRAPYLERTDGTRRV